jgi:replicative DNA helicase
LADYESKLISKCVQSGVLEKVVASGVNESHFSDVDNKNIWNFIVNHWRQYKAAPSPEIVQEKFGEYDWEVVTDPLDYIKDRFIVEVKQRKATEAVLDIGTILDEADPNALATIDELFLDKAKELANAVPSSRVSKFSQMAERIELYKQRKAEGKLAGMRFGLLKLDELTLGLQSHEYVTILGWTGVGKSTLGLWFLLNHYLDGHMPMAVSLEMDEEQIYRKLDSMAVGLRQQAIKSMELHPNEMRKWEEYAERAEKAANDIIIVDLDDATPEQIYAELSRWNPDVAMVDYLQLMRPPNSKKSEWGQISDLAREFKLMTRQLDIPLYGLSQTNAEGEEEGAKLGNIAGSKDIGKHSDIVLGLWQDEMMFEMNKMDVRVLKNRDGRAKITVPMYWKPGSAEFRSWHKDDAYEKGIID